MAYALRMNISEAERIEKRPGLWFICLRITGNGLIDMFAHCFLMELWGRMQYAPTLTDEKGACFLSTVGRRRDGLAGTGFSNSLGLGKLEVLSLCLFLLFLSWLGERKQKKVKPPQGACFLSAVGRGRGGLARVGFSNSLGLGKLDVFFLRLFLLFLSWHKKRRQKKVKPPQGACFLFSVGRGRGGLAGTGFFYL